MKGQVFKVMSDFYLVRIESGQLLTCKARGKMKDKKGGKICVGDYCQVVDGAISQIEQRKNKFIRPNVANVDVLVIVIASNPQPDFYLVDKAIINAIDKSVKVIIAVNKSESEQTLYNAVKNQYQGACLTILSISAKTGQGIEDLKEMLKNQTVVFAGQSAVGKTSIVNALLNLNLKTGALSCKIERGKHTTTYSEIFIKDQIKVVDSPGFASIDVEVQANDLKNYYKEYLDVSLNCKFRSCNHLNEPDCAVKKAVEIGKLSQERYFRYKQIYKELLERREKDYAKN